MFDYYSFRDVKTDGDQNTGFFIRLSSDWCKRIAEISRDIGHYREILGLTPDDIKCMERIRDDYQNAQKPYRVSIKETVRLSSIFSHPAIENTEESLVCAA